MSKIKAEIYDIRSKKIYNSNLEKEQMSNRILLTNKEKDKGKEKEKEKSKQINQETKKENNNNKDINKEKSFYNFYINDDAKNKEFYNFKNNKIDTTKYNIFTFIPKGLLYQFMRLANVYFLFTAILQCIPVISPLGSATALVPIIFVLTVSLIREAYEDCKRANLDKIQNSVKCKVYRNNIWIDIKSGELEMGEIVQVEQDEVFPADLVLLDSPLPEGICFIETGSLDGEKTLKQKNPSPLTIGKFNNDGKCNEMFNLEGECICDQPNPELYFLNGKINMNLNGEVLKFPVDQKQLLLKGAKLKNTQWIVGLIIYTGHNCKIMKNSKDPRVKYSSVEILMNNRLIFIFCTQCFLCIICAICRGIFYNKNLKGNEMMAYMIYDYPIESLLSFFTYLLLLNTMIPISLIVTLEIVKIGQGLFMTADAEGYSFVRDKYIRPNAFSLNEELGMVDYIFTDKTGTLTCNKMMFKYCVMGDQCFQMIRDNEKAGLSPEEEKIRKENDITCFYQNDMLNPEKFNSSHYKNYKILSEDKTVSINLEKLSNIIVQFWTALALCHECSIQVDDDGIEDYIGMSPDSIELVRAARLQGYQLTRAKTSKFRRIKTAVYVSEKIEKIKTLEDNKKYYSMDLDQAIKNEELNNNNKSIKDFELLNIIAFSSDRKRESVIVKDNNIIKLYIKGADTIIEKRLSKNTNPEILAKCQKSVNYFSSQGYRTLLIGMKVLSQNEYDLFAHNLNEANMSLEDKDKKVEEIYDKIEQNIYLIGCTIVEDKLQDKVPETIKDLRNANIKIWMLTGDKMNTAYNIGLSCNLISTNMKIFTICGVEMKINDKMEMENKDECERVIIDFAKEFNMFKENFDSMDKKFQNFGILVDEKALRTINDDEDIQKIFLDIAKDASSVICCRVSPIQKSQVVKMMKNYDKNGVTLAIGDGGNDVSMIMEAHIGIGIYGEEGMRAVQSGDYAIGEFKILHRLLLFHGRIFYFRNSQCILYFFYKNFVFTLVQFIYGFYTNFSGQTIIDDWYISFYNLIFTALPLGARALLDIDLRPEDGKIVKKMLPFLYAELKENPIFNKKIFFLYLLKGVVHCLINFIFTVYSTKDRPIDSDGNIDCLWFTSVDIYTNILIIVSLDLIIDTANITWINAVIQVGTTFIFYIIFLVIVHYLSFFNSFASIHNSIISPVLWMNLIFVGFFSFLFAFVIKSFKYNFLPSICRELKIIYNEYGPINSTEHLSNTIIEKLKVYEENNQNHENKKKVKKKKKNDDNNDMKIIQIQNLNESHEFKKKDSKQFLNE